MKTVLYLWLTLATCRLYAQTQDTLILRHLPPDADAIYRFNLPVITSKLGWQEWADRIPLPQQNTSARELAAILREPFRAGVDPGKDIFWTETPALACISPIAANPEPNTIAPANTLRSLLLHLADSNRFTAFLRDLEPGIHITSQDGQSSAGRNGMAAAWNKSLLVLTFITPLRPDHSHHTVLALRQSKTMLSGYPDTDRITDPFFLKGFTDDADIDAWTAPGKISALLLQYLLRPDNNPESPRLTPPGSEQIRVLSTLRFEKGRVTIKSITPLSPGAALAWGRLIAHPPASPASPAEASAQAGPTPAALATNQTPEAPVITPAIPASANHPLALLNLHINPDAIGDLLDSLHARGRTEALLFDKGLSLENFVDAFQGDLLLSIIAPDSTHSDGITRNILTSSAPVHPALYASIPLQDLTAFWQWMNRLKWLTTSPDLQDGGHGNINTIIGRHIPAWLVKDNCLIIAPDRQHALTWREPAANPGEPAAPLTIRIDLKNMAVIGGQTLDQLLFTAGRLNDNNQIENTLQLTLTDPSRNGLRTLFRLLD